MLIYFIVFLVIISLIFSLVLLATTFNELAFKTFNDLVEIDSICAQNGELTIVDRVKLCFEVCRGLARQLSLWFDA